MPEVLGPVEIECDALIVGGGCGGVAAALALLRRGVRCVIAEPTLMLGGQLSSQGVPPDENPWVEGGGPGAPDSFTGCTATYADFRRRIRDWYRASGQLTPSAAADPRLNPGGGWVSRLCFEPRIAGLILHAMLAQADGGRGLLQILLNRVPVDAQTDRDRVSAVRLEGPGRTIIVHPRFVLEASETGDLFPLAGIEHAIGAEAAHVYGELHGRTDLPPGVNIDPSDQQACTWCFAVEHGPAGQHVIARPPGYHAWRDHVPAMTPPWTGRLFDWIVPSHNVAGRVHLPLIPPPREPASGVLELWRYRRIVNAAVHTDGRPDVSLFNVVQMDHWAAPLLGVDAPARDAALRGAREQAESFLYWMQTEAPRDDGGTGFPGLRLRGEPLGTADGFAMAPYIREPRRLLARAMLTEAHVGLEQRESMGIWRDDAAPYGRGEPFADSIAIGHYPIDLHPSGAGRNSVYVAACPFRVPLAALVPLRVRNLIASGKALGVSHVANGSTRLHPVEWAVGEAAGELAALCIDHHTEPHAVCDDPALAREVQRRLAEAGAPLRWPWEDA